MATPHSLVTAPLLAAVRAEYRLPWLGTHGVTHWARVLENGRRLAETTGANREVVELFAVLHDPDVLRWAWRRSRSDRIPRLAKDEWEVAGPDSGRVSRKDAARIALAYVKRNPLEAPLLDAPHGPTGRIERICSYSEVAARRPLIYGMGEAFWNRHWIVYLEQRGFALRSSLIVAVDRETGAVGYAGSANDEG